jgi:hypothetical protein
LKSEESGTRSAGARGEHSCGCPQGARPDAERESGNAVCGRAFCIRVRRPHAQKLRTSFPPARRGAKGGMAESLEWCPSSSRRTFHTRNHGGHQSPPALKGRHIPAPAEGRGVCTGVVTPRWSRRGDHDRGDHDHADHDHADRIMRIGSCG